MEEKMTTMPTTKSKKKPQDDEIEVKRLIAEFKSGRKEAFAEIVRLYYNQVHALAFKMTRDYDEAADIAQSVFVKMSRHLWKYDPQKRFYTWLYRIATNSAIDHIRKYQRHHHEQIENHSNIGEEFRLGPEFILRRRQLTGYIKEATDCLTKKQRSAFILKDIQGCRVDDVANIMNMPEATVRWYLHRARVTIRKELTRRCPHLLIMMGIK